jgi:hypothetical protein
MGKVFLEYGIKASQSGEVIQTRTRTGFTYSQQQTRTRSCSSSTVWTNSYFYGQNSSFTQQTRRQRTCTSQQVTVKKLFQAQINTTCNWVNTFQSGSSSCSGACLTNGCTQGATRCFLLSSSTCQFQTGQTSSTCTFVQVGQDIDPFCQAEGFACIAGATKTTCETSTQIFFSSWSSFSDYNGSDCSGISSCNSSTVGGVQYECSSRPVNSCSWVFWYSTQDSQCLANNISCSSATTSNPDIDCSSSQVCTCGGWSSWTNTSSCSTQTGSGACGSTLIRDCQTVTLCDFGAWTDWTEVQSCTPATPSCSNNTVQRECRII